MEGGALNLNNLTRPGAILGTKGGKEVPESPEFFLVLEVDSSGKPLKGLSLKPLSSGVPEGSKLVEVEVSLDKIGDKCFVAEPSEVWDLPDSLIQVGHAEGQSFSAALKEHLLRKSIPELLSLGKRVPDFLPGETFVPVSGPLIDNKDITATVDSVLKGWFTAGEVNEKFEKSLAKYIGARHVVTTNSGSSAVLLAVSSLTSEKLGERKLVPGDEVITVAAGFPTGVNPLLLYDLVPVFVDVKIPTYNVDTDLLESAAGPRTKAIILPHTLGNLFNVKSVLSFARKHGLWVIEDACDALGSKYFLSEPQVAGSMAGSFGDISTFSFFPAHHITMGEGGAVATSDPDLATLVSSFRDWGRDCRCKPGQDNICGKRFGYTWKNLPEGFDHKYVFTHAGFNLKITEMQAALGLSQLSKVDAFTAARKRNFSILMEGLKGLEEHLILPKAEDGSDPSWFGFPLTLKKSTRFNRLEMVRFLDERKIGTRMLFAGNLCRQPYFENVRFRLGSSLENTDTVMERTFWLGIHPALSTEMLYYIAESVNDFCRRHRY
jgi:CDP-6-deoxy-D-xylo-4-hexulose-3-dehydrase